MGTEKGNFSYLLCMSFMFAGVDPGFLAGAIIKLNTWKVSLVSCNCL